MEIIFLRHFAMLLFKRRIRNKDFPQQCSESIKSGGKRWRFLRVGVLNFINATFFVPVTRYPTLAARSKLIQGTWTRTFADLDGVSIASGIVSVVGLRKTLIAYFFYRKIKFLNFYDSRDSYITSTFTTFTFSLSATKLSNIYSLPFCCPPQNRRAKNERFVSFMTAPERRKD